MGQHKSDLERVRARFEAWRKTKTYFSSPIPEALWQETVRLSETCSVHEIAKTLGLDFNKVKRRVESHQAAPKAPLADGASQFVELSLCAPVHDCIIELERSDGARMRMSVKGGLGSHVVDLAKVFWSGQ